jgi:hypothetical protein
MAIDINWNGKDQTIMWMDNTCPYKPSTYFVKKERIYIDLLESLSPNEGTNNNENNEANLTEILDAKYQKVNVNEVAQQQQHLTQEQRDKLSKLLYCNNGSVPT